MQIRSNFHRKLFFIAIFLMASFFRLYGLNWDQNQHLHPDERFLTMVANAISWPKSFNEYLNTSVSPLNPHNKGFGFFVYGTFPVIFTKWIAESTGKGDYTNLTLIGRQLSAAFDLGTVILVFLICNQIIEARSTKHELRESKKESKKDSLFVIRNSFFALLSMFLYSTMVLPIQLSHFYAVDTYLTFFITLSFYLLIKIINFPKILNTRYLILNTLLGISFSLALASKITAGLFIPIIGLGLIFFLLRTKKIILLLTSSFLLLTSVYFTFRLAQPYFFANPNIFDITPNAKVLDNWNQLRSFDDMSGGFPPAVQWITTKAYLFPLKNMMLWGLGLPMGLIAISAIIYFIVSLLHCFIVSLRTKKFPLILNSEFLIPTLSLLWILLLFGYQGGQFVKALRYFYPIYPFIAIISGNFIYKVINKFKIGLLGCWVIGLLLIIYPLSFISIYSRPNTRVEASYWIYKNIPPGSTLSSEEWDDGLPLSLERYIHEQYKGIQLPLYWPDNEEKWKLISQRLSQTDYVIETSNRLYGSIMTFPQKYPVSIKYYNSLFDGSLGFEKIAEFTSRPNIPLPDFMNICLTPPFVRYGIVDLKFQNCPLPGISFVDDYADETFTVYDHPKVTVFKKVKSMDYFNFLFQK